MPTMLDKVIDARKRLDDERARLAEDLRTKNQALFEKWSATWNRVTSAVKEVEGTTVRLQTQQEWDRDKTQPPTPRIVETLPLRVRILCPPTDSSKDSDYNQFVEVYVEAVEARKPLGYVWTPPPPPKRKPRGWTPPVPPRGDPVLVSIAKLRCRFDRGYHNHDHTFSRELSMYDVGKKCWQWVTGSSSSDREMSEEEILDHLAAHLAHYLVSAGIPELEKAAQERAAAAAVRPIDV